MRRRLRLLLLACVIALAGWSHPRAQAPGTAFYGIGDLSGGGTNSMVQEATQVGGIVYAVGASTRTATNAPIPNLDTAVVWDSGSSALTIVPDLAVFNPLPTNASPVVYAITPDAQYIAGRLRNDAANPGTASGFKDLRILGGLRVTAGFTALDISDNASIVYGQQSGGGGGVNNSRAVRVDTSGPANTSVQVPLLTPAVITAGGPCSTPVPTCLDNLPAYRGMSSDGSVLIGTAFTGGSTGAQNQYLTTNGLAFRWAYPSASVTEIPRPAGGTWSMAIAISSNGNLTLTGGNSTVYPLGEVWIHTATTGTIQELGSPNTQFSPRLYGGMTADGSVVGVTFMGASPLQSPSFQNNPVQYAYLHNGNGWFHLANVLTAQGVDLWASGWDPSNMILTGIRTVDTDNNGTPDVDLVFGQGRRHNANGSVGATEGFVASFPVGVLSSYQLPAAAPVANRSLVGAWALGSDPNNPLSVMVFLADGTYYTTMSRTRALAAGYGTGAGNFERGVYTLTAGNAVTFTTTEDRDGAGPHQSGPGLVFNGLVSSLNGRQSLSANFTSADTFVIEDATCSPVCSVFQGTRITGAAGSIAGAWTANNPPFFPNGPFIVVFLNNNAGLKYYMIADGALEGQDDGDEGTYVWDANQHQFTLNPVSGSPDVVSASLTSDELGLFINDPPDSFTFTRIVNPSTVLPSITNATLEAAGAEDTAFSYTVTALNALTFGATGLPSGVTIDSTTGVISGTPTVNGTFNVTITVTNTFGDTDSDTLVLTFAAPPAGFHGIGDLPGGVAGSAVRDATRVGGTLYAVGASVQRTQSNLCNNFTANDPSGCIVFPTLDSPVLWTGGTVSPSLVALPEAVHTTPPTNGMTAHALTPSAQYIASQYHATANSTTQFWVRVANAGGALTNQAGGIALITWAISDDGSVLYGQRVASGSNRATRHVFSGATATVADVPLPGSTTVSQPAPHGTTTDGGVMVGVASVGTLAKSNGVAFRYSQATGLSTPIPMLPTGGTWNYPLAISGTGAVTVVAGNSTAHPNGEIYLTDAANTITTTLDSPSEALSPFLFGGMTQDGSVVAVTFGNILSANNPAALPSGNRYAYIHNSHGWFHLSSVLAAEGVDLVANGWDPTNMAVTGIRTVEGVDLVFGEGRRRTPGPTGYVAGAQEGFVAELPVGRLAAFNPTPTPPTDQSIVGTWLVGTDLTNPTSVVSFLSDGTSVRINLNLSAGAPNGVERALYTWAGNAAGGAFGLTTLYDSDGTLGSSARNGQLGTTIFVAGDTLTFTDTNLPGVSAPTLTRVAVSPGSIVGGWVGPSPPTADNFIVPVFTDASGGNKYYIGSHGPFFGGGGVDTGTFTWDPGTDALVLTPTGGVADAPDTVTPSRDELSAHVVGDDGDIFDLTRIVFPATVVPVITSPQVADAVVNEPFSYAITASYGLTFDATGLPPWLVFNSTTGVLSGSPSVAGTDTMTVFATNSFGGSGNAPLVITTRDHQSPLDVVSQASAVYGVTFTAATSGGNGTGAVTYATSGGCTNVGGDAEVTMTSGTLACSITATKAADGSFTQITSGAFLVSAEQVVASVTPTAAGKAFGGIEPVLTGTLAGFLGADSVTATYSRTSGETVAGSPYTISATLAATGDLGNYAITYNTASFTIAAAPQATLTVQVPQSTAVYGSTFIATTDGGSGSGTVTFAASGGCTNTAGGSSITMASGTGTCTVTATKASDGSYAEAISAGVDVVAEKLTASVTPDAAAKVVGGVDPALSGTLIGFLAGDNVTATYSRTLGEAEGPYTISAVLAPVSALGNYAITYNTATFTINPPAPSVQVLSPNGGERVFVGVPTTINWATTGATVSLDVELSRNNGTTYAALAGCVGLPAGTTSCAWTPTTPASTTALVRVTAHPAAGPINDVSNAVFTVVNAAPSVTVTAPNTAVSWTLGSTQSITWNHNLGTLASVRIELSRDNGVSWETLSASTQNSAATTGSFQWIVSGSTTAAALVRVTSLDVSASDVSNLSFAVAAPTVAVTAPNTPVTWRSGTAHNITFTHNLGVGQPFDISVSRDSGATWTPVDTFITTSATAGTYSWLVSGPATATARVRVAWAGGSGVTDDSDADFTISSRIIVTAPNTAVSWASGTVRTITWTHNLLATDTVDITFSPDGGATWVPVASGVPNSSATNGSYTGALPATETGLGLIRVSWTGHPAEFDVSDVVFSLAAPTVTVTAPNTTVSWVIGSHHNITWTHNLGTGESVRLEVSRDGGSTWADVAASVVNTGATSGTFDWLVDGPVTTAASIRAGWTNGGATQDVSNALFNVSSAITVTAPNTAVVWGAGSTRTITWNHSLGAAATFDIAFSSDGGATWTSLASGVTAATATTGTFTGAMPTGVTTQALVRVSPAGLPASGDTSNVVFTLATAAVAVTSPNTNAAWVVGTHHNITWTHNLGTAESVRLELSRDGGASWALIAAAVVNAGVTSGIFDWLVDAPLTSTARIRVSWTKDGAVQDTSNVTFQVVSAISVTAPNTAVTWATGSTRTVTWNHSLGVAATFDVDYSGDNGATWTSLATGVLAATATTGSFTTPMPAVPTTLALVRVSPAGASAIGDTSNVMFTLANPIVTVTAPNTNVAWTIGSNRNLTWSHNLGTAESVNIEVSRDGGVTWAVVANGVTNTAVGTGTFAWTVTGPASTTARIRITWVNNAAVSDISNVNFRIQ